MTVTKETLTRFAAEGALEAAQLAHEVEVAELALAVLVRVTAHAGMITPRQRHSALSSQQITRTEQHEM